MTRTDVHSPTNLITEDYSYAYSYDAHPEEGDRGAVQNLLNVLIADGWKFGQIHGGDTCDHCGAQLRYVAVLKHLPTRTLIKVGETCLENRFELATADFHRLRKAASLNRERIKIVEKTAQWFAENPDNGTAYDFCKKMTAQGDCGYNGMRSDFVAIVNRKGATSDKFVAAIMRDIGRTEERAAKRAVEAANASPVVAGKGVTIKGEIVSLNLHENQYGTREVMTVRDERGFKLWGTQPRFLYDAKVGDTVTFIANVEASETDETFGFYKRPRAAKS